MKKKVLWGSVALFTALGGSSYSQAQESGFTITPQLGYYIHDTKMPYENNGIMGLSLGYQTEKRWGVELGYTSGTPNHEVSGDEWDLEQLSALLRYRFLEGEQARPYILAGAAKQNLTMGNLDIADSLGVLGVGYEITVGSSFQLRPEVRFLNNLDAEDTAIAASLGLQWLIGNTSSGVKPSKPKQDIVVEKDSDLDGVPDQKDQCPNTSKGASVDAVGCEKVMVKDLDNDGVPDEQDQCPDSSEGAKVDEVGCYIVLSETKQIELNVVFENNSAKVADASLVEIQRVADFMRAYPLTEVVLEGHTDDIGSEQYNKKLSTQRAESVANVMIQKFGIASNRVQFAGFGEERPLYRNDTPENRAKNRRVTAVISVSVEKIQN